MIQSPEANNIGAAAAVRRKTRDFGRLGSMARDELEKETISYVLPLM